MIDYKEFGIMKIWGAGKTHTTHRGFQVKEDAIWIFLNFKKVGVYKDKATAQAKIKELIKNAPVDLSEFSHYLD